MDYPYQWEERALADEHLSLTVLDLLVRYPYWVHRRKEQAEILSETAMRWHSSIDFTIPDVAAASTAWLGHRQVALVPIDLLAKEPLLSFDLREESGGAVPTLTRRQNGIVAAAAVTHWAAGILGLSSCELPGQLRETLRQIAQEPPEVGRRLIEQRLPGAGGYESALVEHLGFMAALEWLSTSFALIALLDAAPGERRVLKYSYEREGPTSETQEKRSRCDLAKERFGLRPTTVFIRVPMFQECESFHFEATAPAGTRLVEMALVDRGRVTETGTVDPLWTLGYQQLAESPHRGHIAVSLTSLRDEPAETPDPSNYLAPNVVLSLRLDRSAWLRSAVIAGGVVSLLLWASWWFVLGWGSQETTSIDCTVQGERDIVGLALTCQEAVPDSPLSADPAALMVGLVGLLMVVIVRAGDHAYTAKLVAPLRYVALMTAALPLIGGWLLVFPGPETALLDVGWTLLCVFALIGTGTLLAAFLQRDG